MKKYIIMFALVLLVIKTNAQSGSPFYYYDGKKIELKESEDKLIIRITDPNDLTAKALLQEKIRQDLNFQLLAPTIDNFTGEYFLLVKNRGSVISKAAEISYYIDEPSVASVSFGFDFDDGTVEGVCNDVIVRTAKMDAKQIKEIADRYGVISVNVDRFDPLVFYLVFPKKSSMATWQVANALYETGNFEFASPNFYRRMSKYCATSDTYYPHQWGLSNSVTSGSGCGFSWSSTPGADINVCTAWGLTMGSTEMIVADIDEGVDLTHPDLIMSIPAFGGFDATTGTSPGACGGDDAHGTATSGIMVANNNSIGVVGVAPNCGLLPVKVFFTGGGTTSAILASGINWSWHDGFADVLSNSWGGGSPDPAIDAAISNAVTSGRYGTGCVVVFSTGNSNASSISYPSSNPNVIAVGASSPCDERKSPSSCDGEGWGGNFGTGLGVVAPGVKIATTDIQGHPGISNFSPNPWMCDFPGDEDYIQTFDGTSASCPFVSGAALLVLSANPCLTWKEVRDLIEQTADKVGGVSYTPGFPNGSWNNEMGYGRLDAGKAVTLAWDIYKQNKTETSAIVYSGSHRVFAGYNVTPYIPVGNYVVNPGANITFRCPKSISMEPGFEATPGSVFLAEILPFPTYCDNTHHHYRPAGPGNNSPVSSADAGTLQHGLANEIKIYPNPAHDVLNVSYTLQKSSAVSVDIINALGQKVLNYNFPAGDSNSQVKALSVNNLVPGNYFMVVRIGEEMHQFKFVKD